MQKRTSRNEVRDWDDLRYFLAVYDTGSYTHAGEELKADQSTVGRRIARFERRLGAKLFDRHGRGMRPTPAARGIAELANEVRGTITMLERRFGGIDGDLSGVVRIGATEGLAAGWLTPRLARLQHHHPEILIEVMSGSRIHDLSKREVDIAIRLFRPGEPQVVAQHVGVMRFGLFTVESYAARFGLPNTLDELFQHRVIEHTPLAGVALTRWRQIIERHPNVMYRTNSAAGHQWALRAGFGIGLLPTYAPKLFPELVRVPVELAITVPIWLVSHEETNHIARTRMVLDYVRELFRQDRAEWFS